MNNLVESSNQKRIFIYTDPKELVSGSLPTVKEPVVTGIGTAGSSTTSNSRRSSLSLGMEIVGAQVTGSPAIVSSIPSDGLIKQFGVDIGEGDEILSVNGRLLRNRSDIEIDQIIGESAIESQGELELLVVKQSPTACNGETRRSSDVQLNDSLVTSRSVTAKSRPPSSSSSSIASNSSSSTNAGPKQIRANSHHAPEPLLNNIDEDEPVMAMDVYRNTRRGSAQNMSNNIQIKKHHPICYGEGEFI